ncbi:hypothetical protein B0H17DRAFT_378825 [Mycena rosella]|uniref:Uncharacterized protein n=1 Tax=Mycena rosella TaxID=1033263 RepID=A0AAD7G3G4_MYCRO|nr:hypothetical protein B0H17DRAFT_378825 [Mycena rosella]
MQYLKPSTGFGEDTQYNNIMYAALSDLPTALLPDKPPFGHSETDSAPRALTLRRTLWAQERRACCCISS